MLEYFLHALRFDILAKGLQKLIGVEIQVLNTDKVSKACAVLLATLIASSLKKRQTYDHLCES